VSIAYCTPGKLTAIFWLVGSSTLVSKVNVEGSTFQAPLIDDLYVAISANTDKLKTTSW
jgi:hypothetical protein